MIIVLNIYIYLFVEYILSFMKMSYKTYEKYILF